MHNNRYFIVPYPVPSEILSISVQTEYSLRRPNVAGNLVPIKLHDDDVNTYEVLSPYDEYTKDQILAILATPEWQDNTDFDLLEE